jgi:hypothetical protein
VTSYLVLIPPNGPDSDHRSTIVLADRFSWLALLFPWIWLLTKRLWLEAVAIFVLQLASGWLMQVPGFEAAGWLAGVAIGLLVALEGRQYYAGSLVRRGWSLDAVISADSRASAEDLYFSMLPQSDRKPLPSSSDWAGRAPSVPAGGWRPAYGLFDHEGGR